MKRIGFALVLLFAISVSLISASTLNFEDLGTHWASEIIAESEFAHVLSENDSFQPNKAISRIDFARMLHSALNITINYFRAPDIQETFSDITNEDKGASSLIDLVTTGIVDDKDVFRPNDPLRRDEMIHYVINASSIRPRNYALINDAGLRR